MPPLLVQGLPNRLPLVMSALRKPLTPAEISRAGLTVFGQRMTPKDSRQLLYRLAPETRDFFALNLRLLDHPRAGDVKSLLSFSSEYKGVWSRDSLKTDRQARTQYFAALTGRFPSQEITPAEELQARIIAFRTLERAVISHAEVLLDETKYLPAGFFGRIISGLIKEGATETNIWRLAGLVIKEQEEYLALDECRRQNLSEVLLRLGSPGRQAIAERFYNRSAAIFSGREAGLKPLIPALKILQEQCVPVDFPYAASVIGWGKPLSRIIFKKDKNEGAISELRELLRNQGLELLVSNAADDPMTNGHAAFIYRPRLAREVWRANYDFIAQTYRRFQKTELSWPKKSNEQKIRDFLLNLKNCDFSFFTADLSGLFFGYPQKAVQMYMDEKRSGPLASFCLMTFGYSVFTGDRSLLQDVSTFSQAGSFKLESPLSPFDGFLAGESSLNLSLKAALKAKMGYNTALAALQCGSR